MAYISFQPSDFFNSVLYTGNGTNDTPITGVGFQPDWVWLKNRTSTGSSHLLADSNRGASQRLRSDTTDAEDANGISSFDTDGFTLTSGGNQNSSGANYVAWNWLANGGTTSSNTDGNITSTIQLNQTSGFSIGQYTGNGSNNQTVGTGLNGVPDWVMVKCTSAASTDWAVGTSLISSSNRYLSLNQSWESRTVGPNAGEIQNGGVQILDSYTNGLFNCTSGGASLGSVNANSQTFMFYAFKSIKGFSSFGSYTGNGSTNGTFVYTGFRPAFLILKRIDATENWLVLDSKRDVDNPVGQQLYPNLSAAEGTENRVDFVSNGFKLRNSGTICNTSGGSYIYMAFAEFPFVTSTERPGTAR